MKYLIALSALAWSWCAPTWADTALAAARDISRGEIIAASDVRHTALTGTVRRALATHMADVIGMEAKRHIRRGRHIALADVKGAATIRKGDPVTLEYASPGIRVSVSGRALADAQRGGTVAVMNLYSNRSVRAVAVDAGLARVSKR